MARSEGEGGEGGDDEKAKTAEFVRLPEGPQRPEGQRLVTEGQYEVSPLWWLVTHTGGPNKGHIGGHCGRHIIVTATGGEVQAKKLLIGGNRGEGGQEVEENSKPDVGHSWTRAGGVQAGNAGLYR